MSTNQRAFSPALKKQIAAKKSLVDKNKELSNQYREVKQIYPKVWNDLIGFLERRKTDNQQAISKRMGAMLDPDNPSKIKLVSLNNEQVVSLLDKTSEIDTLLAYLQTKTKPATIESSGIKTKKTQP